MSHSIFRRNLVSELCEILPRMDTVFHVILGPRQVGKTTVADQVVAQLGWPSVVVSADSPVPLDATWIEAQWQFALAKSQLSQTPVVLVLDEIQKINGWSESLKHLWDFQRHDRQRIRVIALGSSAILVQKGLTESLAGRFVLHRLTHWSYPECREAFGWTLDQWLYYGGYPGAVPFIMDPHENGDDDVLWKRYIRDSLIETVISRDVLQLATIAKPTLMRHLFMLAAENPSHIMSYTKMIGRLQDAGNTTTLSHYIRILESAFLVSGLEQFSRGKIRQRGSSPKLIIWNNALVNAVSQRSFSSARQDLSWWGWLVENAVGAHLIAHLDPLEFQISYWRKGDYEVDFVVTCADRIWALEVKSGRTRAAQGLSKFKQEYPTATPMILGYGHIPLDDFFDGSPRRWLV
jgi:predicted AAA+ superfamily ATPase